MPFVPPENPGCTRAKFYVHAVELTSWATVIKLRVVSRGEDNKAWSAATPVGEISMNVANEHAADNFAPGQEWYVDFTPVPLEAVGAEGMGEIA